MCSDDYGRLTSNVSVRELCDRYEALYTRTITDELDERGYRGQTIRAGLEPIDPPLDGPCRAYSGPAAE